MKRNQSIAKYPKMAGYAELTQKNKYLERAIQADECAFDELGLSSGDGSQLTGKQVALLNKGVFELAGGYPYLVDVLNWVCTHRRDYVLYIEDPRQTHCSVPIRWDNFFDYALDGFGDKIIEKSLKNELYRIVREPPLKLVPLGKKTFLTHLIRASIVYSEDENPYPNLKGQKRSIDGIVLDFYKPIWAPLFDGKYGTAWFLTPKAFTARLQYSARRYRFLPEFRRKEYGSVGNFRRLFIYLNLHDNGVSDRLEYDAIDLARDCLPSAVEQRKGKWYLPNRYFLIGFIKKGLRLLHKMAQDGLLEKPQLVPEAVWYDESTKKIIVKVNRGGQLTEFNDKIDVKVPTRYLSI